MEEPMTWVFVPGSNTAHAATRVRAGCKRNALVPPISCEPLQLQTASSTLQRGAAWVPGRAPAVGVRPNYEYDQTSCPAACNWPKQEKLFQLRLQDFRKTQGFV